jgi:CDP-archaeol synthase
VNINPLLISQLTVLLAVANGAPVIAARILGSHFSYPLDHGTVFVDGQPLLGKSKTIRGIVAAILLTVISAPVVGLGWKIGAAVGSLAMAGVAIFVVGEVVLSRLLFKAHIRDRPY